MRSRFQRSVKYIALFFFTLFLFTYRLADQEIISFDSRVYLFALEMWRHGLSWFPTTYGQPYPDYPVASTFLIYLSASLFGGLNKFTAILPSAAAAALTVVMTYKIGELRHKRHGFYAVFLLITTLAFFKSARSIALDMYPTLFTACCFYLVHSAAVKGKPGRVWWIYPILVLSFIFRGPIGLVMPTGVVCLYYLLARNIKQFFVTGFMALFLLILCTVGLLGLAYHVGGVAFLNDVLRMEVMGRIGNQFLPLYFYFVDSFFSYALAYPFAFAVMVGVFYRYYRKSARTADMRFLLQLSGWVLVILVGMSVPGDKKVRYVLPMAPALALLAAYLWSTVAKQKYFAVLRVISIYLFLYLPSIFFLATMYVWHVASRFGFSEILAFMPEAIFFALMQAAGIYFYYTETEADQQAQRLSWVAFSGTACFVVVMLFMVEPIELRVDRTRDFVQTVEKARAEKKARLVFYRERRDGLPIKYVVNMPAEELPLFIADEQALQQVRRPALIITSKSYYNKLSSKVRKRYRIFAEGKIGHVKVVVFERR